MGLKDIKCQDRAVARLQNAFAAGRLAHAYIFAGPEGVGKGTCAEQFAKMLLCDNRTEERTGSTVFFDSCGKCRSCTIFEAGTHPDFRPIYKELLQYTKEGKDRKPPVEMPVDVIREFLIDTAANKPQIGNSTVYVLYEAERLNKSSQNALLKVLEEPPACCHIILICSQPEKMLPTIQSRCQTVRFGPLDEQYIIEKLCRQGLAEPEACYWARFSDGSIGIARQWANLKTGDISCYELKRQIVKRLADCKLKNCLEFADWLAKHSRVISAAWGKSRPELSQTDINRKTQKGLIAMLGAAVADAAHIRTGHDTPSVNSDQGDEIRAIANRFQTDRLVRLATEMYENMLWPQAGVNEKLIFEELLLNYGGCDILMF